MQIITTILLTVAGIIALLLVIALFMKKDHYVRREITINAPRQKVFDYVKLLKNQDNFNKGAMEDADRKREYRGTDGTVGFVYSWSGNKDAGQGEKEIIKIVDGKMVEMEIRFVKPMVATSRIIMETEAISENQTKVSWSNAGILKYPVNFMVPMLEKTLPKGMDSSLKNLKDILEK
jgi:hypothetical protein